MEERKIRRSAFAIVIPFFLIGAVIQFETRNPVFADHGNQSVAQDDVVRVDTNLVTISVNVMDRDGRYVTNLTKEDFQTFEDGVKQDIAFFAPVEQPFTILFLLDTSGSMTFRMEDLARAANAFIGQLRPDDQIIVVTFNDQVEMLKEVEKVKKIREDRVTFELRTGGKSTVIYDAVDDALKRITRVQGRKAIVLFSDGMGQGVFATAKGNLRTAEELDALIYTIQFDVPCVGNQAGCFKVREEPDKYLRALARKTGGRHYLVEGISDLRTTFGLVADELRRYYSLGYYPKKQLTAGQRRQIKVKVRHTNLAVRARDGYIVKPSRKDQ